VQAPVQQSVAANKVRYGLEQLPPLLQGIEQLIVVGRNGKLEHWNLREQSPNLEELAPRLLGPTGNLRAPTLRVGTTLVVGFHEAAYREVLGL
jgi:hypothetical protein